MDPESLQAALDAYNDLNKAVVKHHELAKALASCADQKRISVSIPITCFGSWYVKLPASTLLNASKREVEELHEKLISLGIPSYHLPSVYRMLNPEPQPVPEPLPLPLQPAL